MKLQHIRNATVRLEFAGKTFLIDPFLADKGSYPAFDGTVTGNQDMNPLQPLPVAMDDIISDVDAIIVTHLHIDHWDPVAAQVLGKEIPVFVQNEQDATSIREQGFQKVYVLSDETYFADITLCRTEGEHVDDISRFPDEVQELIGSVCGLVLKHKDEKTIYFTGDTLWNQFVKESISKHNPDIIVANAGGNATIPIGRVVMDQNDLEELAQYSPAELVAIHMEAVNHWVLSRSQLKSFAQEKDFLNRLWVPEYGEEKTF